jgi:plasmid stabilization system protein ParE
MSYKIRILPQARHDIANLADILSPYPNKAKRLFQEMERKIKLLEKTPYAYPVYHASPEYRRMNLEGHALFYIVDEENHEARIYRVIYARRNFSELPDN